MTRAKRLCIGVATATLGIGFYSAAMADRIVDPQSLPPRARAFALNGPLGQLDPYGRPAAPGCRWSRLQVPTATGLRWVAQEECDRPYWR